MKTFTPQEITSLEQNLKQMKEGHTEVVVADLTQDNINEFVYLFNLIVGEYASVLGTTAKVLPPLVLEALDGGRFEGLSNVMIEASEGLLEAAKERVI